MLVDQERGSVVSRALTGDPLRFLGSSWPWRSAAYLLTGWVVACLWWVVTLALLVVPAAWPFVLLTGMPLGTVERWRLRLVDSSPAPSAHRPLVRPGWWGWLTARFREPLTWRELGYALMLTLGLAWLDLVLGMLVVCVLYLISFPLLLLLFPGLRAEELYQWLGVDGLPGAFAVTAAGVLLAALVAYLITAYTAGRVALTRAWLVPRSSDPLDARLVELTRSRARIVEAFDAQRRRIERDLHDGAQQRLTGLIMTLGLARLEFADLPPAARGTVDKAYAEAKAALAELRDLVRGIHPQVLTDRGLAPALAALTQRCPVPVDLQVDLSCRPHESVEAAAWFIAGEALTNVARHSRARQAWLSVRMRQSTLVLEIGDDGVGGADPHRGTGLVGLADRVSVLGGRITIASPAGGPTVLLVELPCD
jgi:signal transduction histidine kinase